MDINCKIYNKLGIPASLNIPSQVLGKSSSLIAHKMLALRHEPFCDLHKTAWQIFYKLYQEKFILPVHRLFTYCPKCDSTENIALRHVNTNGFICCMPLVEPFLGYKNVSALVILKSIGDALGNMAIAVSSWKIYYLVHLGLTNEYVIVADDYYSKVESSMQSDGKGVCK